ncbi:MAG: NADP oxidoreductase [Spirochaetes bacterium GWD1_61_31]|nr:MAG: NADP oxidoreductase [Spirochaetes bacterium GWB1_60_80]OHD29425.1 MAG: NADP oxidoreductase [Spirochaetes bacterium GWC1_61_12]OHD35432.1 MAG: NADP oxidoreductase [Spirochaetes bacterium GWD1_61_31]OHD44941.1 MAG: NADP oxidoreductase [Spirochaetes bacterium GWE1_60_18]OHD60051.1 MAG: NADP oxidoreductase [Spirochaetes bacterium GWF1_60_12]HAP43611.1 NADH-quinone oxidoreductase subunit NuoF [Spirochaetaceae bacterium]
MSIYRTHILVPVDEGTVQAGVFEVKRRLEQKITEQGLGNEVKVVESGTVGIVGKGVILVVYPERMYYTNVRPGDVSLIVEEHLLKGRIPPTLKYASLDIQGGLKSLHNTGLTREQKRVVLDKSWKMSPEDIREVLATGGYKAVEKIFTEKMTPEAVIDLIKQSGLRGRGGAGFPTGLKWEATRKAAGDQKYIICNADEGEPGTFKDRLILEGDPHKLIEAMVIGGYAIGATKGYIYVRGEYGLSIQRMQQAIDQAREYSLLGPSVLETGFAFDLQIKIGAGAYICGDETALIESLEGKRGNPRIKPPYPVTNGLWQMPTAVNNVETLANIPEIVNRGAAWFRTMGTDKCSGTKVFTILGHVEQPGLIEVEMGTPLREIIFAYGGGVAGGKKFKAALLGGASGVFLPEKLLDVHMDFESLKENKAVLGSGAVLVMNEATSIPDMLFSILKFYAHETCGQCAPCRIGTHQLLQLAWKLREGQGRVEDIDTMLNLAETMQRTSLCPLGQSVVAPVKSAIDNFRDEFERAAGHSEIS